MTTQNQTSAVDQRHGARPHRARRTLVTILVLVVGLSAFGLSFMVLRDLAARAGIPEGVAWLWPVIVDGTIAVTTLAAYVSTNNGARATRTVRPGARLQKFTLVLFVIVSVVGNVAHILLAEPDVPWALAVFVAAVPPVGLFLSFEQLVTMLRVDAPNAVHAEAPIHVDSAKEYVPLSAPASSNPGDAPVTAIEVTPSEVDRRQGFTSDQESVTPDVSDVEVTVPVTEVVTADRVNDPGDYHAVTPSDPVTDHVTAPVTALPVSDRSADQAEGHEVEVVTAPVIEVIPADPQEQIEWIVERARAGRDVTRKGLLEAFSEAGHAVSESTVQRRLARARTEAPELFVA